jgi:predicted dehydrogenase
MDKWRYHPAVEALAELARSGTLGAPLGLRTRRVQWGIAPADVDAIWTLLPHDVAIALESLGEIPEPRAAAAERNDGVPTGLVGLLGESPFALLEVSARSPERRREIRLSLEGGVAVWRSDEEGVLTVTRGAPDAETAPEPERVALPVEEPLLKELSAFVRHLSGGPPPKSGAADGARVVQAVASLRKMAGLPDRL